MNTIAKYALASAFALTGIATPSIAGSLPGGASSLTETHGSWQLNCVDDASILTCAISQTQIDPESRLQIISIELRPNGESGLGGALVMPFGLALSKGVAIGIDDQSPNATLGFSTCLPGGCIVTLGLDPSIITALATASVLTVTATASDTDTAIALAIDLSGFSDVVTRMNEILANDE